MKKQSFRIFLRFLTQAFIVGIVFTLAIIHQKLGIEKAAPIDAYCPFGAAESFFTLIFKGEFLKRIFTSSFILMGIFLITTLFFGRVFCGYFCPFGALQEWLRYLGKKIGLKKDWELPAGLDKYLRYLKYIILAAVIYFSFYLGDLIFRNYDPYSALMHFGQEFEEKIIAYVLLFIFLIVALFSKSWWCRYFCPLGAFFVIFKKIGFFKIKREESSCISCGLCDRKCPANLQIANVKEIKDADCISCGRCISNCPKDSLSFYIFRRRISKKYFSWLVLLLVVLPLIIAPFTPFWQTKPESNIVNVQGEINVADIRGSNTLAYLIETTGVPLIEFQKKLSLPSGIDTSLKLKDIGPTYNLYNRAKGILETEDFRQVVVDYNPKADQADCPFLTKDCEFPGDCGLYIDVNQDGACDHSY